MYVFLLQREKKKENPFCKGFYAAVSSSTSRDILKIIFMYDLLKNERIICVIYICATKQEKTTLCNSAPKK